MQLINMICFEEFRILKNMMSPLSLNVILSRSFREKVVIKF